jgi:hypothetical protein
MSSNIELSQDALKKADEVDGYTMTKFFTENFEACNGKWTVAEWDGKEDAAEIVYQGGDEAKARESYNLRKKGVKKSGGWCLLAPPNMNKIEYAESDQARELQIEETYYKKLAVDLEGMDLEEEEDEEDEQ